MSGAEYLLFILMLSIFLGFELINKVPATLHTPLMSVSNAISGIVVIGGLLALEDYATKDIKDDMDTRCGDLGQYQCSGRVFSDRPHAWLLQEEGGLIMSTELITQLGYVVASGLFIFGLKMLGSPATARRGNMFSALGMLIAIVAALLDQGIVDFTWIVAGMLVGGAIGAVAARAVAMTSMPEMVALFNGLGGAASLLVGWSALSPDSGTITLVTIVLSILIGGVTLTGSLIAYGKLSEKIGSGAITFSGQQIVNSLVVLGILGGATMFCLNPTDPNWLYMVIGLALLFGIMAVIPIGGADMPVVISLLNSYSGLAACAAGFAINNNALIVAGSLVGSSGAILSYIMCKAMNRSFVSVILGGCLKRGNCGGGRDQAYHC